jgi:hypothetical protein
LFWKQILLFLDYDNINISTARYWETSNFSGVIISWNPYIQNWLLWTINFKYLHWNLFTHIVSLKVSKSSENVVKTFYKHGAALIVVLTIKTTIIKKLLLSSLSDIHRYILRNQCKNAIYWIVSTEIYSETIAINEFTERSPKEVLSELYIVLKTNSFVSGLRQHKHFNSNVLRNVDFFRCHYQLKSVYTKLTSVNDQFQIFALKSFHTHCISEGIEIIRKRCQDIL